MKTLTYLLSVLVFLPFIASELLTNGNFDLPAGLTSQYEVPTDGTISGWEGTFNVLPSSSA